MDYKSLTTKELRDICAAKDLKDWGSKEQIIKRIQDRDAFLAEQTDEELHLHVPVSDREVFEENVLIEEMLPIDDGSYGASTAVKVSPQTSDGARVDEVVEECNILFAGAATAKYDEDNPHVIEFHGGPRQRQDVTIHQPKKAILMYAKTYCSRADFVTGRMEGSNPLSEALNIDSMTPAQVEQVRETLMKLGMGS